MLRDRQFLSISTWKCASGHSGVQFFDILTSKSGPNLTCSVHFHFKMCFALQPRAIFQHLHFKKWSENVVFCTFSLPNVLLATAAGNFWFLLWRHTSAPAALTSLLFDAPDTRIIEKTQHFATSLPFGAGDSSFFWLSRYCIFFLLTLLHLICFSSPFSTLHIVGSLLFKLPSIIMATMLIGATIIMTAGPWSMKIDSRAAVGVQNTSAPQDESDQQTCHTTRWLHNEWLTSYPDSGQKRKRVVKRMERRWFWAWQFCFLFESVSAQQFWTFIPITHLCSAFR